MGAPGADLGFLVGRRWRGRRPERGAVGAKRRSVERGEVWGGAPYRQSSVREVGRVTMQSHVSRSKTCVTQSEEVSEEVGYQSMWAVVVTQSVQIASVETRVAPVSQPVASRVGIGR